MEIAGLYIFSYLMGALPGAYIVGRVIKGVDVRGYGSGNLGSSNVFHHVGRKWAVSLGIFEILVKGAVPVWIGRYALDLETSSVLLVIAPLLALAGHNWSVFLKFQGGRGLAVVVGTLMALSPILLGVFAVIAIGGWSLTRSSGVWVLISLVSLPVWAVVAREPAMLSYYCIGLVVLTVLKRLLSNWTPLSEELPKGKVLFNRLFRDRDVDDKTAWVRRAPHGTK